MRNHHALQQYVSAIEASALCARVDKHGNLVFMSDSLRQRLEFTPDVAGKAFKQFVDMEQREHFCQRVAQVIHQKQSATEVFKLGQVQKEANWFRCLIVPLYDQAEQLTEISLLLEDISREVYLDELLKESRFDSVTGLATRVDLLNDIKHARAQCLAILDIRKFRSFADYYGLELGDELLRQFSDWSQQFLHQRHLKAYRLYGDKFAICSDFRMIPSVFETHLTHYYQSLSKQQFVINGGEVSIDIAMGMGVGENKLIQLAESALAKAKRVFSGFRIECVREREFTTATKVNWMPKIQAALDNHNIVNYYQPIKATDNEHVDYYEALVRLRDEGDDLPPSSFLEKAKTTRYYSEITRRVIEQAVLQSEQHQVAISVNISIEDVLNPETVEFILDVLQRHAKAQLIFEITETESTDDFGDVEEFARQVRKRGGKIAIDDFGVGYSNFSRLIQLHPDYLKIDGSIIRNILDDKSNASILNGMISICRELGIPMVAEFVENEAVNGYLTEQHIEYLQGYYIGKPAPQISNWLN